MAKRFLGFTPEQRGKILPELAGMQEDEQRKVIASNPAYQQKLGNATEQAMRILNPEPVKARGGMFMPEAQLISQLDPNQIQKLQDANSGVADNFVRPGNTSGQMGTLNPATGAIQPLTPQQLQMLQQNANIDPNKIQQQILPNSLINTEATELQGTPIDMQFGPAINQPMIADQDITNRFRREQQSPSQGQIDLDAAQKAASDAMAAVQAARDAQAADPSNQDLVKALQEQEAALTRAQEGLGVAQQRFKTTEMPSNVEMTTAAVTDPESLVTPTEVAKVETDDKQVIAEGTGQVTGPAPTATVTTAETAAPVVAPEKTPAPTVEATTVSDEINATLDKLTAATGLPSDEALAKAATMKPEELAQLGLDAAQITAAQTVKAPDARKLEEGEMIEGATVDMERVRKETNFEAATGAPSSDATVQGQLTGLMEDFEGKEPPAWAAGAMRAASAQMAARGLSSSSIAGQAIVQAAMESAIPIASQDAKTAASFELQNLSNKQQSAMFAAQQRAEFLNLEFNQEFQTRVANAAKISDIANMNFTAEQQIALENARMAQSVDLANLDAANAKVLSDAAAMSQLDMTNLNNRQQAQVQQANAFLQMDMKNLDNEQQTSVFKTQQRANALLSDQAAENAAKQFNASSEIQVQQFYDNLSASLGMFNSEQTNAQNRFNAGETNAVEQFNKKMLDQRQQFNATNQLIIEQANASWYQSVATMDTAAQNEANRADAAAATNMTALAFSAMMQETRDMMSYAWQAANNDADRATQLAIAQMQSDDAKQAASASKSSGFWGAIGNFASSAIEGYMYGKAKGS